MLVFETEKISQRKAALIVGITLLIMTICSGIAFGTIHNSLIIKGNADATIHNLLNSIPLFRAEIFLWLITLLCDIIVAWGLYIYLKQVDKSLSLLGAWFRLSYCAVLGIAILNLMYVLLLISGDSALMQAGQLNAQLMLFIDAFSKMWSIGLVIFGCHLFIIGILVLESNSIPKFLGILLLIASFSYIMIHSSYLFLPQYEKITKLLENILSLPMAVGELGFGLWLLIKGGKISKTGS